MIPQQMALQLDPLVFSESPPKWHSEANDMGLDLAVSFFVLSVRRAKIFNIQGQQTYLETKIMHDNNVSDVQVWIDRIWKDTDSHSIFANIVLKVKKNEHCSRSFSTYDDGDYSGFPLPSLLWMLNRLGIYVKSFIHMNMPWKSYLYTCQLPIFYSRPCCF